LIVYGDVEVKNRDSKCYNWYKPFTEYERSC